MRDLPFSTHSCTLNTSFAVFGRLPPLAKDLDHDIGLRHEPAIQVQPPKRFARVPHLVTAHANGFSGRSIFILSITRL
jgi:hypothetical protein